MWQRVKDSNPHRRSQSPACYHYTNPLSAVRYVIGVANRYYYTKNSEIVNPFSKKCMEYFFSTFHTLPKGDFMSKRQRTDRPAENTPTLRIEPEKRLCPAFDPVSIALFPVASRSEMGVRVVDNFCEEHIM